MALMRRAGRRRLLLAAALALAAGAGAAGLLAGRAEDGAGSRPGASGGRSGEGVSFLARLIPARTEPARRPGGGASPAELARSLPLERKVAQLFLVGFSGRDLGAEIFARLRAADLGGIVIDRRNYTDVYVLQQLAGELVAVARQAGHVTPFVAAAQEGGELNAFADLPPADAPADLPSVKEASAQATAAAEALRPLGIGAVLGPSIDVGLVDEPALGMRVYSDDPREVARFARATVRAYDRAGVLAAVGHFPGLGAASQPTEEGPAAVGLTLDELRRRDLVPFRAAFRAGAPAVVVGHALSPVGDFTTPASLSHRIVTNLLRDELRFRGLALADDLADPAVSAQLTVPKAAVRAIRAGADMLYVSGPASDQQAAYTAVLRAVRSGALARERVNEAVLRILTAKKRYGLLP